MQPELKHLAATVSEETGLPFDARMARDENGETCFELTPLGHYSAATFVLRTVVGWRRLDLYFIPGTFSADLMNAMRAADNSGRAAFLALLDVCVRDGAEIELFINSSSQDFRSPEIWTQQWRKMELTIRRGMLSINLGDRTADDQLIRTWVTRLATAITALLPLEAADEILAEADVDGYPEGAKTQILVNRYERDRRNRAAALAIHGYRCAACKIEMSERYGDVGAGLIQVHHITPVSALGPEYRINPREDLIPLCPNCHSMVHRRTPPYSVDEVRAMIQSEPAAPSCEEDSDLI